MKVTICYCDICNANTDDNGINKTGEGQYLLKLFYIKQDVEICADCARAISKTIHTLEQAKKE